MDNLVNENNNENKENFTCKTEPAIYNSEVVKETKMLGAGNGADETSTVKNLDSADEISAKCEQEIKNGDEENLNILGKFKNVATLAKAYENLQAEFTRKSQLLKEYERSMRENPNLATEPTLKIFDKDLKIVSNGDATVNELSVKYENLLKNEPINDKNEQKTNENAQEVENGLKNEFNTSKFSNQSTQENEFLNNAKSEVFPNEKSADLINLQIKRLVENGVVNKETYQDIAKKFMENSTLIDNPNGVAEVVIGLLNERATQYQNEMQDTDFIVNLVKNNKQAHDKIISEYVEGCSRKTIPPLMTKTLGSSILASTPSAPTTLSQAKELLEKWLKN